MIYVDLDDCVCETCASLVEFARGRFGRDVRIGDMRDYDLRVSFSFDEETYRKFMREFHGEMLEHIPETPGAVEVLKRWMGEGRGPVIVTGRPTYSHEITRRWLDARGMGGLRIIHVDKYATLFNDSPDPMITPFPALKGMGFEFAIEDAPNAVRMIKETELCPCVVFARPWNGRVGGERVGNWGEIEKMTRGGFAE